MTIQEAIKSGKPFKKKDSSEWLVVSHNKQFIVYDYDNDRVYDLWIYEILADDWIVREE